MDGTKVMSEKLYRYAFNCVACPCTESTVEELEALIDNMRDISLATFKRALGGTLISSIRESFGMASAKSPLGCSLEKDYHLRFASGKHRGRRVYVMIHSAIEYVYVKDS